MKGSVEVVVPLYKTDLSPLELSNIDRFVAVLKNHKFSIVCPKDLDLSPVEKHFQTITYDVKRFSNSFFRGIDGYNRLMLSEVFYLGFSQVDYILICQTDVFVFRDELDFWCSKNFDYIGAPWIGSPRNFWNIYLGKISNFFRKITKKEEKGTEHLFKVGNGGFSLRKVKSHQLIVSKHSKLIDYYIKNHQKENYHVEDVFFSLKAPELEPDFLIPKWETALMFCIDRKPKLALKFNQNKLPFAIHGFDKPKVRKFWSRFIKNNKQ